MNVDPPADNFIVAPGMTARHSTLARPRRLPGLDRLPLAVKNHIVGMLGEFVGTFLFLFFGFTAAQVANMGAAANPLTHAGPNVGALMYIAFAFGFSLAVNAWVFFRISGGLFNPAVRVARDCDFVCTAWAVDADEIRRLRSVLRSSVQSLGFAQDSLLSLNCLVLFRRLELYPRSSQARCSSGRL